MYAGTGKDRDGAVYNSGYDDARGDLYLTKTDHIAYRYEIISLLGKGSFGQVVKCFDHKRRVLLCLFSISALLTILQLIVL